MGKPVRKVWILVTQETMGWLLYQLDHMQVICTLLFQTDNNTSTSLLNFLYRLDADPVQL